MVHGVPKSRPILSSLTVADQIMNVAQIMASIQLFLCPSSAPTPGSDVGVLPPAWGLHVGEQRALFFELMNAGGEAD